MVRLMELVSNRHMWCRNIRWLHQALHVGLIDGVDVFNFSVYVAVYHWSFDIAVRTDVVVRILMVIQCLLQDWRGWDVIALQGCFKEPCAIRRRGS